MQHFLCRFLLRLPEPTQYGFSVLYAVKLLEAPGFFASGIAQYGNPLADKRLSQCNIAIEGDAMAPFLVGRRYTVKNEHDITSTTGGKGGGGSIEMCRRQG